jgi:hypothetical protein
MPIPREFPRQPQAIAGGFVLMPNNRAQHLHDRDVVTMEPRVVTCAAANSARGSIPTFASRLQRPRLQMSESKNH